MHNVRYLVLWLLVSQPCQGHGFSGSGWLHPLTGLDHVLAMLAVGAWSAQVGGRSLYRVPGCFIALMFLGGVAGVNHNVLYRQTWELVVALSVILLGLAIGINQRITEPVAALGVGLFGLSHGLVHGLEMESTQAPLAYLIGFLITTLGLHLIGAVGSLLLLETTNGRMHLRLMGWATALIGLWLIRQ